MNVIDKYISEYSEILVFHHSEHMVAIDQRGQTDF